MKADISTTPRQNSLPGRYHNPQGKDKLLIPPVKGEDYKNLFRNKCIALMKSKNE